MQLHKMNSCDMVRGGYVMNKCGRSLHNGFDGNKEYGCDLISLKSGHNIKDTNINTFTHEAYRVFILCNCIVIQSPYILI